MPTDQLEKKKTQWIAVKHLSVIWSQAQRPLDENFAQKIAREFDPDMFGTVAVTLPNGKGDFHVIDGQTRCRAVEILWGGNEQVPCEVFETTDPARAAQLFDKINSNRRTTQLLDFFPVRVAAGNRDYVEVDRIVRSNGKRVGAKADRNISCCASLLYVYRSHGGVILDGVLKVLEATWGKDEHAFEAALVRGYGDFFSQHRHKANWQRVKEKMQKKYTPGSLIGAARSAREMTGGSIASAVHDLLVANYNRGLPRAQHLLRTRQDEEAAAKAESAEQADET